MHSLPSNGVFGISPIAIISVLFIPFLPSIHSFPLPFYSLPCPSIPLFQSIPSGSIPFVHFPSSFSCSTPSYLTKGSISFRYKFRFQMSSFHSFHPSFHFLNKNVVIQAFPDGGAEPGGPIPPFHPEQSIQSYF